MSDRTFDCGNRLIAAIDVANAGAARALVAQLDGVASFIKIGLELFCAEGPKLVSELVDDGHRVMLDLKLHDIPATVERATRAVAKLGVELLTVHVDGGPAMLEAAVRGAGDRVALLGVTVLTSMDAEALRATGVERAPFELVLSRAELARETGLWGVVASAREAKTLREACGPSFGIVTPGIRPAGCDAGDQKRVMTPAQAIDAGASLLVVGRPIRDADDPRAAAAAIAAEIAG